MSSNKGKIAIIGSGLIGRSWSMLFASVGYHVTIYDIVSTQIDNALGDIQRQLTTLEQTGMIRGTIKSAAEQIKHVSGTNSLKECTSGAFFVLECVPEIFEIKRKALIEVDKTMDVDSILASSTTAIMPSLLAEGLKNKETFIVTHPVNPPYYIPLVELIPSPWTRPEVVPRVRALMIEIGQRPVTMNKECNGFALNRIQYALVTEHYKLVKEGVLTPEDADIAISEGLGRCYAFIGPLEMCHLNAQGMKDYLDKNGKSLEARSTEMGPVIKIGGETGDFICRSLDKRMPLDKLKEHQARRDTNLVKLSKLRNEVDGKNFN